MSAPLLLEIVMVSGLRSAARITGWGTRLLALLALLVGAVLATAVPAAAENAVGASTPVVINTVGHPAGIGPGQRLGEASPQPGIVVATGVAANGVDAAATSAGKDLAESCLNSFTGDTPVTMADGSKRAIKVVQVGDKVLATDPQTGRTEARRVSALIRHSGKHLMVDLTLSDGSTISTTDHHPFWDATTRTFTDAIDLHLGDQVLSDNGQTLTINAEHVYDRTLTAYNLQIDGIHTYYAGTTPVLVHNSCGGFDLFHGTDADSADSLVSGGLSRSRAARLGGGDSFYTTTDEATARVFAEVNPAGGTPAVVGIRIPGGVAGAAERGLITPFKGFPGTYVVDDWDLFSNVASFGRVR